MNMDMIMQYQDLPTKIKLLERTATALEMPQARLLDESLRVYMERLLWTEQAAAHEIAAKYGVASFDDMKAQYEQGTLGEEGSWEDFLRLEHAEHRSAMLRDLLNDV